MSMDEPDPMRPGAGKDTPFAARPEDPAASIRARWNLRPVINCSGNNTALGASSALPAVIDAVSEMMAEFVDVADLQRKASASIADTMGSEAGTVSASLAAGVAVAVAGTITGPDLAAIEQLPDAGDRPNEVLIQAGHDVHYGQPIEQAVRIGGGRLVRVGTPTRTMPYQLEDALQRPLAAALFVVSHHAIDHGNIQFADFAAACRRHGVPVIVDLADVLDFRPYHELGADITLHSAHKFLRGHTGGIVAGRKELVRAAFLQNFGIGRSMKVGKEAVAGVIAALEAWSAGVQQKGYAYNERHLDDWIKRLEGQPGVTTRIVNLPTGPNRRALRLEVEPQVANMLARDLSQALARRDTPIFVSDHRVDEGWLLLNPYQLHPGEEAVVAEAILDELARARAAPQRDFSQQPKYAASNFTGFERFLNWPDRPTG